MVAPISSWQGPSKRGGREGDWIIPVLQMQRLRLPACLGSTEKAWADAPLIPNLLLGAAPNRCDVASSASETMDSTAGDTSR